MEAKLSTSLYLAQSYQDAWSDYQRSLKTLSFPVWDYVILTASNEHQADGFRAQIRARREYLPERTVFAVIPDEGGVRVGSGGATLSVLRYLREQIPSFAGRRILVIHSGGDSRRVPQYSAMGKLFSPVPHRLPDGRSSTLFDEFIIAMSAVPGRIREGMLLLSGDVLLLFNPLLIDYSGHGAAAISFKENVRTGMEHGVFLRGADGCVQAFLHKQTAERLRETGAVNEAGAVDIDTGALIFGVDVLDALWSLISENGRFSKERYDSLVNEEVRLSLYGDFQYPLAENSTLEEFYREKPEGEMTPALQRARRQLWEALRPFRMKLLRLAPAKFIHFGTTAEILRLMTGEVDRYAELGWSRQVNCAMAEGSGYGSVLSSSARLLGDCYLEVSYVHDGARVGRGAVISGLDLGNGMEVPERVVLHGLRLMNGRFVCRIYGTDDNPKQPVLFGRELDMLLRACGAEPSLLWEAGEGRSLWTARLYPACDTMEEAVRCALRLYALVQGGDIRELASWQDRRSLCSGFHDADPEALLGWERRMTELVAMNRLAERIARGRPAEEGTLCAPLTRVQRIRNAEPGTAMRLHYYAGRALGDEGETAAAFALLGQVILRETLSGLRENTEARIRCSEHSVELPLRVNWGGGWSDTPPYCNENGGTVLNAAVLLGGRHSVQMCPAGQDRSGPAYYRRPVRVRLARLPEKKIVFDSRDMDVHGEFDEIAPLQSVGDPFDSFVLQKAALLACGVIPAKGGELGAILERLGGGILMDTEVFGVPKGSGLGTSSILAAACVRALYEFLGIPCHEDLLYSTVLCMEQMMSTGGGWQDQAGGATDGIKYISSRPGIRQQLTVQHVELDPRTKAELNARFALIYTGQRRLARNLLRDVVGRYIGGEQQTVRALNEIQRVAALMRFELERGHVDDFATLLSDHWELSRQIDSGSTNTLIDQIFDAVDDLVAGRMVCGAGGGGFLQVVMKRGVSRDMLQSRLKEVFQDTDINVWDCELV